MVLFYKFFNNKHFAVNVTDDISQESIGKIDWLFGSGVRLSKSELDGIFVGPKPGTTEEWIVPFKNLAFEQNVIGLIDIAGFTKQDDREMTYNPIFNKLYQNIGQDIFEELK